MRQLAALSILLSLTFATIAPLRAQGQQQSGPDDVVRISTNLVQIDALVTDKNGNPIKDLTADDFEVLQDGRPQKIVSVAFVNTEVPQTQNMNPPTASVNKDQNAPLAPPTRTRGANAGRILTFVVDDGSCSASRVGMVAAQEALEKFVIEQMQPTDLVAIYQTRSGSSILQQYTSDKSQLMRVVKKIRWYPPRGVCANSGSGDFYDRAEVTSGLKYKGNPVEFESEANKANRVNTENRLRDNQVVGLIGVLRYITRGLQKVPGRKTVFLLSDGIPLLATESQQRGAPGTPALVTLKPGDSSGAMRELIDFA
ncbi:MAG: VWA domain-containing protein, partial [Pyrinomonadaceae bacterium]